MDVRPPKWAQPGQKLQLQLAPIAELRVQVPKGRKGGDQLQITRADWKDIYVDIPMGLRPGDVFHYTPDALMVAAPEGSCAGQFVVFPHHKVGPGGRLETEYCRAR